MYRLLLTALLIPLLIACNEKNKGNVPVIGYVDAFEDPTIAQAKKGFLDALAANGFSEKEKTIQILYRNAQGNIPTLSQIVNYFKSEEVKAIAACPSIATISAIQNGGGIPVFMMVSPEPALLQLQMKGDSAPAHLYGVGENLDYIDTSFAMIAKLMDIKDREIRIGMVYNQAEPQSTEALEKIKTMAARINADVIALPVNSSADIQLVTQSLLNKGIDAFFANPDNTVFAGFEVILKSCEQAHVPVFTSEAGLVARGAVAAYGADLYQWGYQTGLLMASFLKKGEGATPLYEMVKVRNKVYLPAAAKRHHISVPPDFKAITG